MCTFRSDNLSSDSTEWHRAGGGDNVGKNPFADKNESIMSIQLCWQCLAPSAALSRQLPITIYRLRDYSLFLCSSFFGSAIEIFCAFICSGEIGISRWTVLNALCFVCKYIIMFVLVYCSKLMRQKIEWLRFAIVIICVYGERSTRSRCALADTKKSQ